MSFTLLFSSYLFHFFPLPCSHIFSWCLLSLAVAWVATSWKYWFLFSLLFFFSSCLLFYNPCSSPFPIPVLHLRLGGWRMTTSLAAHPALVFRCFFLFFCAVSWFIFFLPETRFRRHIVAFAVFESIPCYVGAESRSRGCHRVGGFLSAITSLYSPLHPSKQHRPVYRHLAHSRPQPLTTHSPWQHTNNCKLLPLVRSPQSEMSF